MQRTAHLFAAMALLSACSGEQAPTATATTHTQSTAAAAATTAATTTTTVESNDMGRDRDRDFALREDLETIRRVTAPFHNFAVATAAGWSTEVTNCLLDTGGVGGMGFHYGKTALIDGTVRVDKPQLLLYEPEKNGRLRLMAVEYIIPYSDHSRAAAPPVLMGQKFLQFDAFQVWGLHVWIWKDNPSGLFAPWNPLVTCQYASDVSTMAH
jgi:hypothetical protein